MNHQLCPLSCGTWAPSKVKGGPEERGLIRGRERKEFSLSIVPSIPASWQSVQPPWNVFPRTFSLATRKRPHDTQKENSLSNVVGGGKRRPSVKLLPPRIPLESSNFLLENSISSNVYFRKRGIYVRKNSVSSLEILGKRPSEPEQMFEENLATRTRVSTKRSQAR